LFYNVIIVMKNKIQKLLEQNIEIWDGIEFSSKDSKSQIACVIWVKKWPIVLWWCENIYEIYVSMDGILFHYPNDASDKLWWNGNYDITHDVKLIKRLYEVNISIT
jgi:phage pi2 protein 07